MNFLLVGFIYPSLAYLPTEYRIENLMSIKEGIFELNQNLREIP
jgi:hypothetical protein